jgi:purine-binding chemotaxis protein CheW
VDDDDHHSAEQLSIFPLEIPPPIKTFTTVALSAAKTVPAVLRHPEKKSGRVSSRFSDPSTEQKQKLQKLLHSARVDIAVAPLLAVEVAALTAARFCAVPDEIQEWVIEPVIKVAEAVAELDVVQNVAQETVQKIVQDVKEDVTQSYQMPGLEWLPNGLPPWAQANFDVLLLKVSGLTLAVPLISLGKIQPITDELTPIFGQADWFMGLLPTAAGKIRTVNTAKFVMPERYDENFAKNAKYVVSINGVPWGLAVDSVNQPIKLSPNAVKWRTNRSKRPWLAGTIKEHMCALLDIPMIGQMLINADKNFAKTRPN